jgi:integrase
VIAMLDEIAGRGSGIMANRTRALTSKIFNFAIQRGVVEYNPIHNVPIPGEERRRDRVLSEEEIRHVWRVLDCERLAIAATLKLALLTVQRRSEVLGIRWEELDLETGWWTIPAERAKNKLAHRVPLARRASISSRDSESRPTAPHMSSRAPKKSRSRIYRSPCGVFASEQASNFAFTICAARLRVT